LLDFLKFDANNTVEIKDGRTSIVSFTQLYKGCQTSGEFIEKAINQLNKAFQKEYEFYLAVRKEILAVKPFYAANLNKIRTEENPIKCVTESLVASIYRRMIKGISVGSCIVSSSIKVPFLKFANKKKVLEVAFENELNKQAIPTIQAAMQTMASTTEYLVR